MLLSQSYSSGFVVLEVLKMALLREVELKYKHSDVDDEKYQKSLTSPESVYQLFNELVYETKEKFIAVMLDNQNQIMCYEMVGLGTVSGCTIRPVEVFRSAIILNSPAMIIVHNHPSGLPKPSASDRLITNKLLEVSKLLDIKILDHVIVGHCGFYSFSQKGEL